jgi:hypothetical protein
MKKTIISILVLQTVLFSKLVAQGADDCGTTSVSLKIFDVLGREVQTLVNEIRKAGSYNVVFDASKLASGVYIYKLQAGNFIATKKMLLAK